VGFRHLVNQRRGLDFFQADHVYAKGVQGASSFWFIDQIREYIFDLDRKKTRRRRQADDEDTSPLVDRKKSGLNTAQASNADLREVIATLAANMAAIATKVERDV
jgi:hypothetical protein